MKLIGSTTSPYVRKVRIVLAEKKARLPVRAGQRLGMTPR